MFGLFNKRKRENGTASNLGPPRLSAELKALQDREFAERLHQRLLEKTGTDGAKIEPKFKTAGAARPAAAPHPSSVPPRTDRAAGALAPKPDTRAPDTRAPDMRPRAVAPEAARSPAPGADTSHAPAKPVTPAPPPPKPAAAAIADERPASVLAPAALPLVMRAAQYAAERHKTQRRRGAAREPYVNHLLEVAALLATATDGNDPELVTAGLLHDLIEDQGVSLDEIARQFGVGVAALVLEVTTDKSLPEGERHRLQVTHAGRKSPRARMLRMADMISNLKALRQSPPADWPIDRQREYFQRAHDVAATSRGISPQLDSWFDEAHAAGPAAPDTAA